MEISFALSFLLLFATCQAFTLPPRSTTTTRPPTATTAAFQPHGPIQQAIYNFLRPDGGSKGLEPIANGCMLVFCHVFKKVDKEPENGCRSSCVDFANRFEDGIDTDWLNAGLYTAVKNQNDCVKACSGLSFMSESYDNKRRCESLCTFKFYYPDWKAYQDQLIVVLENLHTSPRLPIY
ncbi:hypothetical protein PRIPAC_88599 [Pristionchus pacificus]|uniref:Uncharacterized protein n=1 Tax=Pristionchus pacificus TaxID=54126 RepID=A0A2A6CVN5_PRIPA|nr:hypothetical protein PRIPAC_88599 [Pristionchus pacificus]|eukprot:PDM82219.1 hypothetical protein PRIPAC_36612 [Pristionchus pacificus]